MCDEQIYETISSCFDECYAGCSQDVRTIRQNEENYLIVNVETPGENSITVRVAIGRQFINEHSDNLGDLRNQVAIFVKSRIEKAITNYNCIEKMPEGHRVWVLG